MPAPKKNKNALKLRDPEIRQEAYHQYCAWIAKGYSGRSFTFQRGELKCTGQTIESYIKENPVEFPPIHKEFAKAQGLAYYETILHDSAVGFNKDANTASLQMIMRNKFDWDKAEKESQVADSEFDRFLQNLKKGLL